VWGKRRCASLPEKLSGYAAAYSAWMGQEYLSGGLAIKATNINKLALIWEYYCLFWLHK